MGLYPLPLWQGGLGGPGRFDCPDTHKTYLPYLGPLKLLLQNLAKYHLN